MLRPVADKISRRPRRGASPGKPRKAPEASAGRGIPPAAVATAITALLVFAPKLPFTTPYSPRFAALLLAAAAWTWVWAAARLGRARPRRFFMAAAAVAGVVILSAAASPTPLVLLTFGAEGGLMGAPSWLALLGVLALAARAPLVREVRLAASAAGLWVASSALTAVVERIRGFEAAAGFGNGNYLAAVMLLVAPLLLAAALEEEGAWAAAYRAAAVLAWLTVVLAASATGIAGLALQILALLVAAPRLLGPAVAARSKPLSIAVASLLVAALALGVLYVAGGPVPAQLRSVLAGKVFTYTTQTRAEMWKAAVTVWKASPVLGAGPDGFQLASQSALSKRLMQLEGGATTGHRALIRDPHSLPLLALASLGIAGVAALAWLAAEWTILLRRRLAKGGAERDFRAGAAIGVGAFMFCMLLVPWTVVFAAMPALVAGLAVAPSAGTSPRREEVPGPRILILSAAALSVTVAAAWLVQASIRGDAFSLRALEAETTLDSHALWTRAASVQPHRPYLEKERLYTAGMLAQQGAYPVESYRREAGSASEVLANAGYRAELVQPLLDLAYLSGSREVGWELEHVREAVRVAPNHPDVLLERAHLALIVEDLAVAESNLDVVGGYAGASGDRYLLYRYYLADLRTDIKGMQTWAARLRQEAAWLQPLMVPRQRQ